MKSITISKETIERIKEELEDVNVTPPKTSPQWNELIDDIINVGLATYIETL